VLFYSRQKQQSYHVAVVISRIGATVLSFHVDFFARFTSYFLITIGCINAFILGLIFRQHIKLRRSLTSWRERAKDVIPTKVAGVNVAPIIDHVPDAIHAFRAGKGDSQKDNNGKTTMFTNGMGFGKEGQKFAGLNGRFFSCTSVLNLGLTCSTV
jgi:hypothetical protein